MNMPQATKKGLGKGAFYILLGTVVIGAGYFLYTLALPTLTIGGSYAGYLVDLSRAHAILIMFVIFGSVINLYGWIQLIYLHFATREMRLSTS